MKFTVNREILLRPLVLVASAVERRQTLPVLSNLLLSVSGKKLHITGTDLEVELQALVGLESSADHKGEITVPARKLVDICKSLPESSDITVAVDDGKAIVRSGRSRFTLSTLPAMDFPSIQKDESSNSVTLPKQTLASLINKTSFSMAQQDVRYYLNGMLWEISGKSIKAVATDGHRLAIADAKLNAKFEGKKQQIIVPRKGVLELLRLLDDGEDDIEIQFGGNHVRATVDNMAFTSKLVDGKFPDYERVLPKGGDKLVVADRQEMRAALSRSAILSNEKFRGIRFMLSDGLVGIQANNPEQEEAHEEISVEYQGDSLEMGFNVSYLIDVLGVFSHEHVRITLSDANSSALIQDGDESNTALYVVMPMRL